MQKRSLVFLFGMIVGGCAVGFAFEYHLVQSNDGLMLVQKKHASLSCLYADVRTWKPEEWQAHPDLVHSLVAKGRADLIGEQATDLMHDTLEKFKTAEKPREEFRVQ